MRKKRFPERFSVALTSELMERLVAHAKLELRSRESMARRLIWEALNARESVKPALVNHSGLSESA
jgi:hypothetical protein